MYIALSRRRRLQPKSAVGIDWSYPLARGLVQLVDHNGINVVIGKPGTRQGSLKIGVGQDGLAFRVDTIADTTSGLFLDTTPGIGTGEMTQFVHIGSFSNNGGNYSYGCGNYNGSSGTGIALHHTTVSGRWGVFDAGVVIDSGESLVQNAKYVIAHTRSSGNGHRLYSNGSLKQSASNSPFSDASNSGYRQNTLGSNGVQWGATSRINGSGRFNRALHPEEVRQFSSNQWSVLRPRTRHLFYSTGTGGTLNASASGAATASGEAAISADVGLAAIGVAVAGGSAALSANVPVTAAGLAVSGGNANAVAAVSIAAADLAQAAGQAGLSASVLLQAAGAAQASGNATLAASLEALASGNAQASGSATLSGGAPGALSASGSAEAGGQAVLTVSVQLAATGAAQAGGSATGSASAPGSISASGGAIAGGFSTWSALVTLTAAGFVQAMGSGSLVVDVPLAATGQATAGGQATPSMAGAAGGCWLHALAPRRATLAIADDYRLTRIVHGVTRA